MKKWRDAFENSGLSVQGPLEFEWHTVHYIGDRERFRQQKKSGFVLFHRNRRSALGLLRSRDTIAQADLMCEAVQTTKRIGPIWILHWMLYFIYKCQIVSVICFGF